jgi:antitoxin CptB
MMSELEDKKIRWQCRRGMLELDVLMHHYYDHFYIAASLQDKQKFQKLLTYSDQTLWRWVLQQEEPEDSQLTDLVSQLRHAWQERDQS